MIGKKKKASEDPQDFIVRKEYKKAIDIFREKLKQQPQNSNLRLALADALLSNSQVAEALREYKELAAKYTDEHFILKAVAVYKKMLKIRPDMKDVEKLLAGLSEKREDESPVAPGEPEMFEVVDSGSILLHQKASVRYLFSTRQASVTGSLKKAFLYGRTAVPLFRLHHYDGIQSRTYLTTLVSLVALGLPPLSRWVCGMALFLYSFTCRIQTSKSKGIPFAFLGIFASIPLIMLNLHRKTADFSMIPAGSITTAGLAYLAYLSAKNTIRNYRKGEKPGSLPATFLFCVAWRLISGTGYLYGACERFANQLARTKQLEKHENTSN